MDILVVTNKLSNFSFLLLFGSVIFYWSEACFLLPIKYRFIGKFGMISANVTLFFFLILRWIFFNHFPLSNLYESLIFLSWSLTLIHNILETKITKNFLQNLNFSIGTITAPMAFFPNSFASLSLPLEMQKGGVLVPALQSNWLMMHVTIMMLSYAALLIGSLLSITFLFVSFFNPIKKPFTFFNLSKESIMSVSATIPIEKNNSFEINKLQKLEFEETKKLEETLDNLSYRMLGLGFPLLTIGILSGAVWANSAWGSYWSWDPKETWAFITWLVFAIYLHTRITKGWKGKKPAIIATIGFLVVWICYLGVNFLGKGLHSYGWVKLPV